MDNEWEKFGKEIRNIVEDAVNAQDFNQLNRTITNTVNEAVGSIQRGLKTAGQAVNEAARTKNGFQWTSYPKNENQREWEERYQRNQFEDLKVPKPDSDHTKLELFKKNIPVKAGGMVLTIFGYTFSFGTGAAVIILLLVSFFLGSFPIGIKIALSILAPLFLGSMVMAWKGSSILGALKRYHRYIAELQGKTYCNIKELADRSGKSFSFVLKDVKRMIDKGWFRQGHLDEDNTCLIVSHDTYEEYQNIQKQRIEQKQSEIKQKNNSQEVCVNSEVQKVIAKGKEYIEKIRKSNEAIAGEEISRKISHMEMLIQKIFDRVKEDPDSLEDIQKLMEYYLPTTVKLLDAYQQLDSQPVQGANIKSSKAEIEKTLDTLNIAFEKLLDSLFEDVAWDVSSDISVLHTMLAQEGLTGNDFEKK